MGLYAMTTDPVLPPMKECGAGDEPRTRDLRLGKPALYQLSYARMARMALRTARRVTPTSAKIAAQSPA